MTVPKRTHLLAVCLYLLLPTGYLTLAKVRANRTHAEHEFAKRVESASGALLRQGKLAEARQVLQQWSEMQPRNSRAWRERGVAAATARDFEQAEQFLQKSVVLNPQDGAAWLTLGGVYFAQKNWEKSESACRAAAALEPNNTQVALGLARALVAQNKNAPEAESLARRAVAAGEGGAAGHFALAQSLLLQNKNKEAQWAVMRGLSLNAASVYGFELLAQINRALGDTAQAEKATRTAAEIRQFSPQSKTVPVPIRIARGEALLETEQYKQALAEYLPVVRQDPTNAAALEGAALALLGLGDKTTASAYLAEAVGHDSQRVRSRIALGLTAYEMGLYKAAVDNFAVATQVQPGNALAWHGMGQAQAARHLFQKEAEAALRQAAELDPQNPVYLMDFADTLNTNNKASEAEAVYRRALALTLDDPQANGRFGAFLAQLPPDPNRYIEAETALQRSLAKAPNDPFTQFHLGQLLVKREQYADAIPLLKGATRNGQGRTKDVWSVLARAYRYVGQKDKAAAAIGEADKIQQIADRYDRATERLGSELNNPGARLEMARAAAARGENTRAFAEYASYLRRRPGDSAVKQERDKLAASLKTVGKMPDMVLYNRIGAATTDAR